MQPLKLRSHSAIADLESDIVIGVGKTLPNYFTNPLCFIFAKWVHCSTDTGFVNCICLQFDCIVFRIKHTYSQPGPRKTDAWGTGWHTLCSRCSFEHFSVLYIACRLVIYHSCFLYHFLLLNIHVFDNKSLLTIGSLNPNLQERIPLCFFCFEFSWFMLGLVHSW